MEEVCKNIQFEVLTSDKSEQFFHENNWLDKSGFLKICEQYGYPENPITIIVEEYYIDSAYRDVYYNYWAKFHFDWPRHCRRVFLFQNAHMKEDVFGNLSGDFLGTIVVRPSYSGGTEHTFGRTLLDPYKMVSKNASGGFRPLLKYLKTAHYSVHLLGCTYKIRAFPFSSQDGVAMRCAETAIYELCDYASTASALYARVLPSDIQKSLKQRTPERILPSRGLYCNDISFVLKNFGFSPMIYVETPSTDCANNRLEAYESIIGLISTASGVCLPEPEVATIQLWDMEHRTSFKNWFHYYVESGIPLLIVTSPNQLVNKHAALVIGHGEKQKDISDCKIYQLGHFPCVDTAEFYEDYIVQDDNQIPYKEEKMDKFTQQGDYKLDAFIVPLDKHVFLDASSAVSICDTYITEADETIEDALNCLIAFYRKYAEEVQDDEDKQQCLDMIEILTASEENPITIRYYLANSAKYKRFRINNGETIDDKMFFADVPMPKSVWVAEISTFELYKMGYAFGEVVIDATASNQSKLCGIILFRTGHLGVYRLPGESYDVIEKGLDGSANYESLSPMFPLFSNFLNDEIEYHRIE